MGKLLDKYKSGIGRSEKEKLAMEYLVDYMLGSPRTGTGKSISLTPTDIEGKLKTFAPSMFYTFMYTPQKGDGVEIYDAVPLVLVTSFDGTAVNGINFNLIPNDARAAIIDMMLDGYSGYYKNADEDKPLNERLALAMMNPVALASVLNAMSNETGLDITKAMRRYLLKGIMMPRMIEYEMWEYIPYLTFKDAIRGDKLIRMQAALVKALRRR